MEHLNSIFEASGTSSVTVANLRSPTGDFAREIITSALRESGVKLSSNVIKLLQDHTSSKALGITNDLITPLHLMTSARKFFTDLAIAAGENVNLSLTFSINDLLSPESKRLKYFLSHFVNFWLFQNSHYHLYTSLLQEVEQKEDKRAQLDEKIESFKHHNNELRKNKASSEMKAEKIKAKIEHDKEKLMKLTEDVKSLTEELSHVKENLIDAKEKESDFGNQIKGLEKNEFRLKTISKADETKQELEAQLVALSRDEDEKLHQINVYETKGQELEEDISSMSDAVTSISVTKESSSKKKTLSNEKKSIMADCEVSHEKLEAVETQLVARQRAFEAVKAEIGNIKGKWEKKKTLLGSDLTSYTEELCSMSKAMGEDDMVNHELDSK